MKCVIFAAGRGNRLKPYTDTIPKPLIEIKGKPILHHLIDSIPDEIDEYFIIVKYMSEKIENYIKINFPNKKIICVTQNTALGTYGALKAAESYLDDSKFLVLSADDLYDKNELSKMISLERAFGVQNKIMPGYYAIEKDPDGKISSMREPTDSEKAGGTPVATGAYLLDKKIFEFEPVLLRDGEYGLPQTIIANTSTYKVDYFEMCKWQPINTTEDLENVKIS